MHIDGADAGDSVPSTAGQNPLSYVYAVHPPCAAESQHDRYRPGDVVFVTLRSERDTGRAVVLEDPAPPAADGRVLVSYLNGEGTHRVRPGRLARVHPRGAGLVLVTSNTEDYRRLARSQLNHQDAALDVGCSYGAATRALADHARPGCVIGLDVGTDCVVAARRAHPGIRFEVADALETRWGARAKLTALAAEAMAGGAERLAVFLDIGGNRELETLSRVVPELLDLLSPSLMVIKSSALRSSADAHSSAQELSGSHGSPRSAPRVPGEVPAAAAWWDGLQEIRERPGAPAAAVVAPALPPRPGDGSHGALVGNTGKPVYPLMYPVRLIPTGDPGRAVCRFFSFGTCLKAGACTFAHVCYWCCGGDHRAADCPRAEERV